MNERCLGIGIPEPIKKMPVGVVRVDVVLCDKRQVRAKGELPLWGQIEPAVGAECKGIDGNRAD